MILQEPLIMSNAAALTASVNSDVIDLLKAGDAESAPWARVSVRETFAGATSLTANIVTSDTSNFAVKKVLLTSGTVAAAGLTGKAVLINARLPIGVQRYVRTEYTLDGTATAGKVDSFIVNGTEDAQAARSVDAVS